MSIFQNVFAETVRFFFPVPALNFSFNSLYFLLCTYLSRRTGCLSTCRGLSMTVSVRVYLYRSGNLFEYRQWNWNSGLFSELFGVLPFHITNIFLQHMTWIILHSFTDWRRLTQLKSVFYNKILDKINWKKKTNNKTIENI